MIEIRRQKQLQFHTQIRKNQREQDFKDQRNIFSDVEFLPRYQTFQENPTLISLHNLIQDHEDFIINSGETQIDLTQYVIELTTINGKNKEDQNYKIVDIFFPLVNQWTSPSLLSHILKQTILIYYSLPSYRTVVNLIKKIILVSEENENEDLHLRNNMVQILLNYSKYDMIPLVDFLIDNLSQKSYHIIENALEFLLVFVENRFEFNGRVEMLMEKFCIILGKTQNTTIIKQICSIARHFNQEIILQYKLPFELIKGITTNTLETSLQGLRQITSEETIRPTLDLLQVKMLEIVKQSRQLNEFMNFFEQSRIVFDFTPQLSERVLRIMDEEDLNDDQIQFIQLYIQAAVQH